MNEKGFDANSLDNENEGQVYKVPYSPWFIATSKVGKLLQAWFIIYFILTYIAVENYILQELGFVFGIPYILAWFYGLAVITIIVLYLGYTYRMKEVSERVAKNYEAYEKEAD